MYFEVGGTWFNRSLVTLVKATENTGNWYVTFRYSGSSSDVYLPEQYATESLAQDGVRAFLLGE